MRVLGPILDSTVSIGTKSEFFSIFNKFRHGETSLATVRSNGTNIACVGTEFAASDVSWDQFCNFLKDKSLEEVAEDYIEALVERNLVMVTRNKSNGKALCYGLHDLLRDLCRRKGGEEKFVDVMNERSVEVAMAVALKKVRRVSVHASDSCGMEDVDAMVFARSLIVCLENMLGGKIISPVILALRLLRVLDVFDVTFKDFPVEVVKLVNLRFLALSCSSKSALPRGISRLLNLQTLIAQLHAGGVSVPSEIWEMSELRHLKLFSGMYIEEVYMKQNMQEKLKLQTLRSVVCDHSVIWTGFFKTIPNTVNLGIHVLESSEVVVDLRHLQKLETLRCQSSGCWRYLPTLRFPASLTKLSLFKCLIYARDWTTLCALHNLEVLKICYCVLENEVIELEETEEEKYVFQSLQLLQMGYLKNLVRWTADDANFPTLRELILLDCPLLEEIPSSIGDISTPQLIYLWKCRPQPNRFRRNKLRMATTTSKLTYMVEQGC